MSKYLFSVLGLTLTACSQTYDVHTNMDPGNFQEYFKPSQVKLIEADSLPAGTRSLAAVTGSSCQQTSTDKPVDPAEARTQAKVAVADIGGNALVIDVCETQEFTEMPSCHKLLTCYGRALKLDAQQ